MNNLPEGFYNVSERYGEQVIVTIADYQALNPEGAFELGWSGVEVIIERFSDKPGDFEVVARPEYQVEKADGTPAVIVPDASEFPDEWPDEFLSDDELARK